MLHIIILVDNIEETSNSNIDRFNTDNSTHKTNQKHITILALGGSITAGGYYMEFVRCMHK